MRLDHRQRRLTAWFAVLAFLVSLLAPMAVHASAADDAHPWAEICSTGGSAPQVPSDAAAHLFEHCPACALHADALGLPPGEPPAALPPLPLADAPAAFLHAPRTLHTWVRARTRAPPLPA